MSDGPETSVPLGVELGSQILFRSFEPAQGSLPLQQDVLRMVASQNPQWNLTFRKKAEIENDTAKIVGRYLSNPNSPHGKVDFDSHKIQIDATFKAFIESIGKRLSPEELSNLSAAIAEGVIIRDYKYVVLDGGRPGKEGLLSSYFLNFIYPGGSSFGIPQLNNVFKRVRSDWLKRSDDDYWFVNIKDYLEGKQYAQAVEELANTTPALIVRQITDKINSNSPTLA